KLPLITIRDSRLAVSMCEDLWHSEGLARDLASAGAEVIVHIHASPFHIGTSRSREQMLSTYARANRVIIASTNMVGGQDELIFDGNSVIIDRHGEVMARAKAFEEDLLRADLDMEEMRPENLMSGWKEPVPWKIAGELESIAIDHHPSVEARERMTPRLEPTLGELEEVYKGLVLGVKAYVEKNGFQKAVIGLSGGVDSALTVVIAVDALGSGNVLGVFMPSPYTSVESAEDAAELSSRLGVECRTISITAPFESYLRSLAPVFQGKPVDLAEENIQARIRGNVLMAISNKFGHLVLTTGNKSEMSVGYSTLYGDMAGGFAVIKDVPKTMVYELARMRNRQGTTPIIPLRILERPPTAELKPNQKDEDSLPPYAVLDPILKAYIEESRSAEEIVAQGFDCATVRRVVSMVKQSEYKRRQAPVGIKITPRGLGKDRRMPITNGYGCSP
ncbi:MAG: NAD+ synthase, partial [Nitrospira sp.]|nr:NAD+ synthase [Nitrospira sp.]